MDKTAVIYSRVSTEEQGKGFSLPTQVESCRKYAVEKGYRVVAEFQDMHTGTELDRPGLGALYEFVEKEHVEILLVHDIDRLSREVGNQAIIEMELGNAGVQIEYVIGQYGHNAEGELMKIIKSGIAQYENRQRVERSRRGKIGKAKAGNIVCPTGRAPFGYTYNSDERRGWFTINENEAEVVRKIYSMLIEDALSSYAIARHLWEAHILTKGDYSDVVFKKSGHGEWSPSTVRRIVSNPAYKGIWYYGKTRREKVNGKRRQVAVPQSDWVAVEIPAIVTGSVWDQAQECLERNKQQARRNTKREYLLRGMVFCRCGRRWTGIYKNHLKRAYYRCPTNEAELWRHRCDNRYSIRQEVLENTVWANVSALFLDPKTLLDGLNAQRETSAEELERRTRRIAAVEQTIKDVDAKLGMLLDQMLVGEFAKSVVEEKRTALMSQRGELEFERNRLRSEMEKTVLTTGAEEELVSFAKKVRGSILHADFQTKRRILELVRTRVSVLGPKQIEICCLITSEQIVDLSSA